MSLFWRATSIRHSGGLFIIKWHPLAVMESLRGIRVWWKFLSVKAVSAVATWGKEGHPLAWERQKWTRYGDQKCRSINVRRGWRKKGSKDRKAKQRLCSPATEVRWWRGASDRAVRALVARLCAQLFPRMVSKVGI